MYAALWAKMNQTQDVSVELWIRPEISQEATGEENSGGEVSFLKYKFFLMTNHDIFLNIKKIQKIKLGREGQGHVPFP